MATTYYYGKDKAGNPVYESSTPGAKATSSPSGGGAVVAAPYSTSPTQSTAITGDAAQPAISASILGTQAPTIPTYTAPTPTLSNAALGAVTGAANGAAATTTQTDTMAAATKPSTAGQDYVKAITNLETPNKADIYNNLEKTNQLDAKRQAVNTYQSQINAIVAKSNADKLSVMGQGRGIPEVIIGGQQAQIDKEAAIQSLPIAAQLAAAQGDLTTAQDHVDKLFSIYSADADAKYKHQTDVISAVYQVANADEQRQLDYLAEQRKQANAIQLQNIGLANDITKTAMENSPAIGAKLMALDPNSADYAKKFSAIAATLPPDALKQAQIAYTKAQTAKIKADMGSGSVNITNPQASIYGTALSTILASGKFTQDQKASLIQGINSGGDAFSIVKNQAKNIMGQTEATNVTKLEVARDTLSDIGTQLAAFYAAGGNTNIVSGNFEKVVNNLGAVKDPKLVNLATQIQGNLQIYRNAISGTAYSAQEGKDISSIFPGIDKSAALNSAILGARQTLFDSVIDSSYRSALGPTYDDLKTSNQTGLKGSQTNAAFVDQVLTQRGVNYDAAVKALPSVLDGIPQRKVINNATGMIGTIPEFEYDPKLYTPL